MREGAAYAEILRPEAVQAAVLHHREQRHQRVLVATTIQYTLEVNIEYYTNTIYCTRSALEYGYVRTNTTGILFTITVLVDYKSIAQYEYV